MDRRIVAWSGTAVLFVVLYAGVPLVGLAIDRGLGLPPLPNPVRFAGPLLLVFGAAGLAWCLRLFVRARGTPNPILPPKRLVTSGPYAWTRNPIAGSHFLAVLGVGLILGSLGAIFVTFLLGIPAHFLVRREERTLEARFAAEYRVYRASVPRWIPRRRLHQR